MSSIQSEPARHTHDGTLDALMTWTSRCSGYARAVVWTHNSHLGDAGATQMGAWGKLNLGQLARERHAERVFLIGFTTHTGTVTAAREWDEPAGRLRVRPSISGSYERLFHDTDIKRTREPLLSCEHGGPVRCGGSHRHNIRPHAAGAVVA